MAWPDICIDGGLVTFNHLRSHILTVSGLDPNLPEPMTVLVRYSDHCFSEGFDDAVHSVSAVLPWCTHNSADKRVFSRERYDWSFQLRPLIEGLASRRVHQTTRVRNFMLVTTHRNQSGEPYNVFFNLGRASPGAAHNLVMTVVSAYTSNAPTASVRSSPTNIRFRMLCGKAWRGESLAFRR
jgi:hypothetical protein